VAVEPKVTTQGNVAVKQWQKLPSELMANLAKKEGRKKHPHIVVLEVALVLALALALRTAGCFGID
jgi:hypothetical protein